MTHQQSQLPQLHRIPIQPPIRSFTMPVKDHTRKNSDLSESVQTRPSIDEDLLFEEDEESEEEVYDPANVQLHLPTRQSDVMLPKTPLTSSPIHAPTHIDTHNNSNLDIPDIRHRMDGHGLRPLITHHNQNLVNYLRQLLHQLIEVET
ncbi:9304_t:CDS:2 [Ambispora leptoticha]|uniref:9304_t:CDS:1 n=1 Tax=Ambispora leptoticha TaxID=144679 RepID=A0A9N9I1T4_9GLOM|nr:9304_t:CDS:2 [Ambispora leptoticha]